MVSSSKSLRYILGLVIFINLQLEAVVKGQFEIDCTKTDWNQNGTDCPKGMKEIVKVVDRNAGTSRKFCCNPDTKGGTWFYQHNYFLNSIFKRVFHQLAVFYQNLQNPI